MNDSEYAAAIQDACKRGATISAIKCFVESIRKEERERFVKVCDALSKEGWHENQEYGAYGEFDDAVKAIRMLNLTQYPVISKDC